MWYIIRQFLLKVSVVSLVTVLVEAGVLPLMPPYYPDCSLAAHFVCVLAIAMLYHCHTHRPNPRPLGGRLIRSLREQDGLAELTAILTCAVVLGTALILTLRLLPFTLVVSVLVAAYKKIRARGQVNELAGEWDGV